jgi:hypothetical protein
MGFLDKAKEKAGKLVDATKERVDDLKDKRKAGDLLEDLGRIVYRQHTERGTPDDATEIARLVTDLQALEAEGTEGIVVKAAAPDDANAADAAAGDSAAGASNGSGAVPPPPPAPHPTPES